MNSPSIEASLPFPEIFILAELAAALAHSPELSFLYSIVLIEMGQ